MTFNTKFFPVMMPGEPIEKIYPMKDGQKYLFHIDGDIPGIWRTGQYDEKHNSVFGTNFLFHIEQVTNFIELEKLEIVENPLYKVPEPERYKYKLLFILQQMNNEDYKKAMVEIPKICNISPKTLKKWMYIPYDSDREILTRYSILLANYFEIQPVELYTDISQFNLFQDVQDNQL